MMRFHPSVVLPFLTLLASLNPALAAELTPESRVSEVTVYRQAVLVTREAKLTLPPGEHRVVLKGIPCVADPDSMRASGTGSAGIEIGGVDVQQEFRQPDLPPEYRQVQKELEELNRRQALINGERTTIATLREFLAGLRVTRGLRSIRGRRRSTSSRRGQAHSPSRSAPWTRGRRS